MYLAITCWAQRANCLWAMINFIFFHSFTNKKKKIKQILKKKIEKYQVAYLYWVLIELYKRWMHNQNGKRWEWRIKYIKCGWHSYMGKATVVIRVGLKVLCLFKKMGEETKG